MNFRDLNVIGLFHFFCLILFLGSNDDSQQGTCNVSQNTLYTKLYGGPIDSG